MDPGCRPRPTAAARVRAPTDVAAPPPAAEGSTRRVWGRAEALVSVGLESDAADLFAVLGDRAGGRLRGPRATDLQRRHERRVAADLARRLVALIVERSGPG